MRLKLSFNPRYKRLLPLLILAVVVVSSVVYWLATHSFVSIVPTSGAAGELTYELFEQRSGKTKTLKGGPEGVTAFVRSGGYEISVHSSASSSFYTVHTAKRFMQKSKVEASLTAEDSRTFIGNGPQPCVVRTGQSTVSYPCSGDFNSLRTHLPATERIPSYHVSGKWPSSESIEGMIEVAEGTVMLTKVAPTARTFGYHALYRLEERDRQPVEPVLIRQLPELNKDASYALLAFEKGFIAYDTTDGSLFYYSSVLSGSGQKIDTYKKRSGDTSLLGINTDGANISAVYGTATDSPVSFSEILVGGLERTDYLKVAFSVSSAQKCGADKICLLGEGGEFAVYLSTSKGYARSTVIKNVRSLRVVDNLPLIMNASGVIRLNPETGTGHYSFRFGDYRFVSTSIGREDLYLNLTDYKNNAIVLALNPTPLAGGAFDKQVLKLQYEPVIKNVTAYENYLFITPNLGEAEFNPSLDAFVYNPEVISQSNKSIDKIVKDIGIDTTSYTVVNTSL